MGWVTWLRAGSGNTVIAFALGAAPLSIVTGLTIDSSRISAARVEAQAALSAAVWTFAAKPNIDPLLARQTFFDNRAGDSVFVLRTLDFAVDHNGDYVGTASILPPAGIMSLLGLVPDEIVIRIRAPQSARTGSTVAAAKATKPPLAPR
jgi:hypothetical protein